MNRKIVGFIGSAETCNKAAEILQGFGFYKLEIETKVRNFAKYVMRLPDEEISKEVLDQVRNRGYLVYQSYWTNLAFPDVPQNKERIVISDFRVEDIVVGVTPYFLGSPDQKDSCPAHVSFIDATDHLKESLEKLFKPVAH